MPQGMNSPVAEGPPWQRDLKTNINDAFGIA